MERFHGESFTLLQHMTGVEDVDPVLAKLDLGAAAVAQPDAEKDGAPAKSSEAAAQGVRPILDLLDDDKNPLAGAGPDRGTLKEGNDDLEEFTEFGPGLPSPQKLLDPEISIGGGASSFGGPPGRPPKPGAPGVRLKPGGPAPGPGGPGPRPGLGGVGPRGPGPPGGVPKPGGVGGVPKPGGVGGGPTSSASLGARPRPGAGSSGYGSQASGYGQKAPAKTQSKTGVPGGVVAGGGGKVPAAKPGGGPGAAGSSSVGKSPSQTFSRDTPG